MGDRNYRVALNHALQRIDRLEYELREIRQFVVNQELQQTGPAAQFVNVAHSDMLPPEKNKTAYWEVTCLGNFHLRCAGRELTPLRSRRSESILKYLLASPEHTASSETLIEQFWPHSDPTAGARSLQVAVHSLRLALRGCGPDNSDETVLFRNNRYLLNPALSIVQDVDRFRALYKQGQAAANAGDFLTARQAFEQAHACYTGEFLTDTADEWVFGPRLAVQDMLLALLSQLGFLYRRSKECERAISYYQDILAVDGYREDVYRDLMRCFAACNRPADIKRTYLACHERLRCELHLSPAYETTRVYHELMQQALKPVRS